MQKKALFLDRDGILIEDTAYPHRAEDLTIKREILPLLQKARERDYLLIIVTNQSGIGRGIFTEEQFKAFQDLLFAEFRQLGIEFDGSYHCPYLKDAPLEQYRMESQDRKPRPGMLLRAKKDFDLNMEGSIMIGDKASDKIEIPGLQCHLLQGKYPIPKELNPHGSFQEIIEILGWN